MSKELVIFDIDNTIVKGQSQKLLLSYLYRKKIIGFSYYLRIYVWFILYKLGLIRNPKKTMEYAFMFLKGKVVEETEKIIDNFFEEVLKKHIFEEAINLINDHRSKNREILLLSNIIDVLAKKITDFLGVRYCISTKLEIIDGKYTGKILGDIVYGENKEVFAKNFIQGNNFSVNTSWAYGDHITDLNVLKSVKYPFAVNPDKSFYKEAQKRKWPILAFNKTLL